MQHDLLKREGLPMAFIVDTKNKQVSFATDQLVMVDDTISAMNLNGTIKEIIDEHPSKGAWPLREVVPTYYKVQLY